MTDALLMIPVSHFHVRVVELRLNYAHVKLMLTSETLTTRARL